MSKHLSNRVRKVITSCETITQLRAAEKYMILAGIDQTALVDKMDEKLMSKAKARFMTNTEINNEFNRLTNK